jgi:hypothetical protein
MKAKSVEQAVGALLKAPMPPDARYPTSPIEEILDIARWTPSGDNAQPWRFHLVDGDTVIVKVRDESRHNVYEYRNAEPTLLSAGMLLESMRIAATAFHRAMTWHYAGRTDSSYEMSVRFQLDDAIEPDPLYAFLPLRSVDRSPYQVQPLTAGEEQGLYTALGNQLALKFHPRINDRWRFARLSARATAIRLSIPEAFSIHQRIIDWQRTQSPTGIPASAVGLDPMTLKVMRWAMQRWSRTQFLNLLGGTFTAALQMDYLPGLCSAAYFTMRMPEGGSPDERVRALLTAGQGIQRFWLTATKLGLAVQPSLAPLAFAHYGKMSLPFTGSASQRRASQRLASALEAFLGVTTDELVFMGRIGRPRRRTQISRSTRRPLDELIER